jgi:CcmD family protein
MIFSKNKRFLTIILFLAVHLPVLMAQGNRDFMRETGKINVVTAVIVCIFLGIVWYLLRLERKLTKIEHQIFDENERKN